MNGLNERTEHVLGSLPYEVWFSFFLQVSFLLEGIAASTMFIGNLPLVPFVAALIQLNGIIME